MVIYHGIYNQPTMWIAFSHVYIYIFRMFGLFFLMGVWIDWDDAILVLKGSKSNRHGIAMRV